MKEHILHLRKHMAAREPLFVGKEISVPGTMDKALVGNGMHPDNQAHLQGREYAKAEAIGETLYTPVGSVLIAPSPLARGVESAMYVFVGMARSYARHVLGINTENPSLEDKKKLSEQGLHKLARFQYFQGLTETQYKDSDRNPDKGNELVAEAYNKEVNPDFEGYRWMVQKGFEGDPRSEYPQKIAERGLGELVPALLRYDTVLSASHQPNLEIITAALTGDFGTDGNELFERAGGAYGMGGGFELRVYETEGKIHEARLRRTGKDPKNLEQELIVDPGVLIRYV